MTPEKRLLQDDPEGEYVGATCQTSTGLELFGSEISLGAPDSRSATQGAHQRVACDAEVDQHPVPVGCHHDVGRLDVAMNDPSRCPQSVDSDRDIPPDDPGLPRCKGASVPKQSVERQSGHKLCCHNSNVAAPDRRAPSVVQFSRGSGTRSREAPPPLSPGALRARCHRTALQRPSNRSVRQRGIPAPGHPRRSGASPNSPTALRSTPVA